MATQFTRQIQSFHVNLRSSLVPEFTSFLRTLEQHIIRKMLSFVLKYSLQVKIIQYLDYSVYKPYLLEQTSFSFTYFFFPHLHTSDKLKAHQEENGCFPFSWLLPWECTEERKPETFEHNYIKKTRHVNPKHFSKILHRKYYAAL